MLPPDGGSKGAGPYQKVPREVNAIFLNRRSGGRSEFAALMVDLYDARQSPDDTVRAAGRCSKRRRARAD